MPKSANLERIKEHQFFIKPQIENALKNQILTEEGKKQINTKAINYHEYWVECYSDRFFDMTTMIRMGAVIEEALKESYMRLKGHKNQAELRSDPDFKQGIFQRININASQSGSAYVLFHSNRLDINSLPEITKVREVMLHRHLYAHNLGVIDEKYVQDWKSLTGEDLSSNASLANFQVEDIYWFEPLKNINDYIAALDKFVKSLP